MAFYVCRMRTLLCVYNSLVRWCIKEIANDKYAEDADSYCENLVRSLEVKFTTAMADFVVNTQDGIYAQDDDVRRMVALCRDDMLCNIRKMYIPGKGEGACLTTMASSATQVVFNLLLLLLLLL